MTDNLKHLDRIAADQGETPATALAGTTQPTEADEVAAARKGIEGRYQLKGEGEPIRVIRQGPKAEQTGAERANNVKNYGTWEEFERRFDPISNPRGGDEERESMLLDTTELAQCDPAHVWTVVNGEGSKLYILEGWHAIDTLGYLICRNPRKEMPLHGGAYKTFLY